MTTSKEFSEHTVNPNPFLQFRSWFTEHLYSGIRIPDTLSLGTSTAEGHISVRTVLLKEYDENGFVFYTNYNSRKGRALLAHPQAAMLFYWPESGRQVRIEGITEKTDAAESETYFKTRPRESQLSSWASDQSSVIPDRNYLEGRYDYFKNQMSDKPVPKPHHWGGFRLVPDWFEFWQEGEFRLHDRLSYTKKGSLWVLERLSP